MFFSSAQETFSRIKHILGHKISLNKLKRTEIIPCISSDHNNMKLKINHKKKSGNNTNTWRSNNMLLNNEWVNQKVKEQLKKNTRRQMKMKPQLSKTEL